MATVRVLENLEIALSRTGRKTPPAQDDPDLARLLNDVTAIMQSEIGSHFAFEEERLFPLVEDMGGSPMLAILRDEHNTIRPLAARMTEAVKASRQNGFDSGSWAELYDLGMELVERETFHIQKEEMAFLPMLDELIEPDVDSDLSMAFAEAR
jgi:hemerythrin-like domain-containing protein